MSRVAAKLWQIAQKMPVLPDSVLRNCSSTVANAMPVWLSPVGLNLVSAGADSRPVLGSIVMLRSGTLSR